MTLLFASRLKLIAWCVLLSSTSCSKPASPTAPKARNSEASRVANENIRGIFSGGWEMPSLIRLCTQDRRLCEEDGGFDGYCSIEFSLAASQQLSRLRIRNRVNSDRSEWIEGTGQRTAVPPTIEDRRECHVIMTEVRIAENVPLTALRKAAAKRVKAQEEQKTQELALQRTGPRLARPINASIWATDADYPLSALKEHVEGTVRFRVTIAPTGIVRECSVVSSSGSMALDAVTCSLVSERARFQPALVDGIPIEGSWSGAVRWKIPPMKSK